MKCLCIDCSENFLFCISKRVDDLYRKYCKSKYRRNDLSVLNEDVFKNRLREFFIKLRMQGSDGIFCRL